MGNYGKLTIVGLFPWLNYQGVPNHPSAGGMMSLGDKQLLRDSNYPIRGVDDCLILFDLYPICSMYGIFTYICIIFKANVGKDYIHGASGYGMPH